jgi:hypothetical protein
MKKSLSLIGYKLTNLIKHIMAFKDIFKDTNDYNEKTIIGFISFLMMVIAMAVDLITGYVGKELVLNEYIFNAFMYITLGSFGIAGLEKFAPQKKSSESSEE